MADRKTVAKKPAAKKAAKPDEMAALRAETAALRRAVRAQGAVIAGLRVESQLRDEQAAAVAAVAALAGDA